MEVLDEPPINLDGELTKLWLIFFVKKSTEAK